MTIKLELDVTETGPNVVGAITRAGGIIRMFIEHGVGGGNACYIVDAPDRESAQAIIHALYGSDPDATDLEVDTYLRSPAFDAANGLV